MKRLAASILLLIYFAVTTGFVVSVHWCMNRLDSVELGHSEEKECGKCGMHLEQSKGCCKDDVKVVKMKADHNLAKAFVPDFGLAIPANIFSGDTFFLSRHAQQKALPLAHGPPLSGQDTYLRNRVFRL